EKLPRGEIVAQPVEQPAHDGAEFGKAIGHPDVGVGFAVAAVQGEFDRRILVGLFLSEQFKLPILDPIIALLVGLWVIKNAAKLFLQVNFELMDGNADNSLYQKLFSAVSSVQGVHNPHKARIRKMASLFDIDLDIEVDPAMTVYDAHEKAEQVEEASREVIPEASDIQLHIEPLGSDSHQREEKYGLKPDDM
ncbi:MAG: hypothetical protein J6W63_00850, partial [Treponema sp.]|nr:hypothetical protein [Treponema sp.]